MEKNVYGWCPMCGQPGFERERRLNGNDNCEAGHVYTSTQAIEDEELAARIRVLFALTKNDCKLLDELTDRIQNSTPEEWVD